MERVIRLLLALAICTVAALASAESDKNYNQEMLDVLLEQGVINESQHEELSRKAQQEHQAKNANSASQTAAADDPESWKVYWKNSTHIERNDGLFKFLLGGRIQLDAAAISADNTIQNLFDVEGTGVDVRRARIFMSGKFFDHGIFKVQYDFAGQDVDFEDVWVGVQDLPGVKSLRFGHFKEAYSLSFQTSSKYNTFMERALHVDAFTPGRNLGIGSNNTAFDKRMTWHLGGFRVTGDDAESFSHNSQYNITGRVTGLPLYQAKGRKLIHLGASYSHKFDNTVEFGTKPEANLSNALVNTGEIPTNGVDLVGLEFVSVLGPVSLQGEWSSTWVDQQGGPNLAFWGAYAEASWFITGEHRPYRTDIGSFGRVEPKEIFSLDKGTWGAFELAARYSYLDLSDQNIRGGTENNTTLGINWHLYSNFRIMANWVHAHLNGVGNENIAQMRFSLEF